MLPPTNSQISWWLRRKASAFNVGDPGSIPGLEDPLEKAMAPHSRTLAWKTPWTEKPDKLQSMGSQRVRHDRATSLSLTSLTVRRGSPKESGSGNTRRCRYSRRRGQQCWASVWGLLCKALRTGYHRLW